MNDFPEHIHLRPMRDADLPAVHRLEVSSQPVPWPLWFFRRQLRSSASCWVLVADEAIIGFGIVAFEKDRAHIMNMCVAPGYRRRGLGQYRMVPGSDLAIQLMLTQKSLDFTRCIALAGHFRGQNEAFKIAQDHNLIAYKMPPCGKNPECHTGRILVSKWAFQSLETVLSWVKNIILSARYSGPTPCNRIIS